MTTPSLKVVDVTDPSVARGVLGAIAAQAPIRLATAMACFTFDDAYAEDFTEIRPIGITYGVKFGFPFHSNFPGNAGSSSWAQMKQMFDEGHEMIGHTRSHAHLNALSESAAEAEIDNRSVFESHGITVRGFAYPFGEMNATVRRLVRKHFDYGLATVTGSSGSQKPLSTYAIRRIAIKDSTVTATHYAQVDAAIANGEILVFIIHSGVAGGEFSEAGGGVQRLKDVIAYCQSHSLPIVTPGQAFAQARNLIDTGDYPSGAGFVVDQEGNEHSPAALPVLAHASDALTKLPSVFPAGITLQQYQSSSGSPGAGPGTVQTVIVSAGVGGAGVGGLNFQTFQRNSNAGLYIRSAASDNASWAAWQQIYPVTSTGITILADSTSAIGTVPSAYNLGVTLQGVIATASPATPSGGPGVLRTVVTVAGAGTSAGQLNYQEFVASSNGGKWIRSGMNDNSAWLSTWKRVEVDGGLAPVVHALTTKTTPVSNDEFLLIDSAASNVGKRILYSDLLAAVAAGVSAASDADALTAGESTFSRRQVTNAATLSTGIMRLTYFTAKKTETTTSVRTRTGTFTPSGTPTICRVGIYTVDGSGNLTLVASTTNDTAMWAAADTSYTKALTASLSKVAGQRYAIGLLVVTAGTAPTIQGQTFPGADEMAVAPRLSGAQSGQTDLPSSVTVGSVSNSNHQCYVALVP